VRGESDSNAGYGIYGLTTAATGTNYGVYGSSASTGGYGVYGSTVHNVGVFGDASGLSGTNYGVRGHSDSTSGYGVYGTSVLYGVRGIANATGVTTGYGVRGSSSGATTTDWGVYSTGDLGAGGTKSFNIDYPLDPENKWLRHYCSEGPEPMNAYSGVAVTNTKGEAWVDLPEYFEAINKNFRYTLTVVDDSDSDIFVQAKIARKVQNNRFKIRTNAPNVEVSWEVKAVRNDPWVKAHPPKDIVAKGGAEVGKYEHPELYGMPEQDGIESAPTPAVAKKVGSRRS